MRGISKRQQEILDYVTYFQKKYHYSPSLREIGQHFNFTVKAAYDHIEALKKKNLLNNKERFSRTLTLVDKEYAEDRLITVPVLKNFSETESIFSEESFSDCISLSKNMIGRIREENIFALYFSGESMKDAKIEDGDLAIIEKTEKAEPNDIVLVNFREYSENRLTLRRFCLNSDNSIELRAENSSFQDLYPQEGTVCGKLIMILRRFL